MSEITKVGLTDVQDGFQMQCIENVDKDANLEMVVLGEKKLSGYELEGGTYKTWLKIFEDISTPSLSLILDSFSTTPLEVGDYNKIYLRSKHSANGGTCKIIPVGYCQVPGVPTNFGFTPLGEFTLSASSCYINIGETNEYYSHIQSVDVCGFTHIHFLISEITVGESESNWISLWAWPGKFVIEAVEEGGGEE